MAHPRGEHRRRAGGEHTGQAVVRWDDACGEPVAVVPVVAVQVRCGPVPIDVGRGMAAGDDGGRTNLPGHQRAAPVSPYEEPRALGPGRAEVVTHDDTDHPPGAISSHVGHDQSEAEARAGLLRGGDQQSVKDGSPGSVEGIHPGVRLQRDGHGVMAIVERDPADRRRAGGGYPIQQAPAVQLQDSAAHQGVGGQCVRAAARSFDDQHTHAGAGEQQGRRGASHSAADDDHIPGDGGGQGVLTSICTSVPLTSTS